MEGIRYKPLEENLEGGVSQLGKQIRSMPHIVIGRDKKTQITKNGGDAEPSVPPTDPLFSPKESTWISKLKKWGLFSAVMAVILYAAYRIIRGFL